MRDDEDLRALGDVSQTGPVPATTTTTRQDARVSHHEALGRDTVAVLLDAINEQGRRMEAQVEKVRADVSGLRQLMYRELPREYVPRQELAGRLERIERDLRDHQEDLDELRAQLGLTREDASERISSQRTAVDSRWIGLLQALVLAGVAAFMGWLLRGH